MQHAATTRAIFADDASSRLTTKSGRQTIHQMLVPFPVAYFVAAFVTDLAYWRTPDVMWERFSVWLITAGLIMAAFVVFAAVIDLAARRQRPVWPRTLGYALALLLSLLNVFVHSRDGYTAVMPTGLMLSGLVVVILLFTSSAGWTLTYRHRDGAGT
jgi:uncharacterized membrane protein